MPSYLAGKGPRSNMSFITFTCMCENFNSKDIRIKPTRLQSKYRKLVNLQNLHKSELATEIENLFQHLQKNYD